MFTDLGKNLTIFDSSDEDVGSTYTENDDDVEQRPLSVENLKAELYKKKNLTVGYLTAIKGELKDRQGLAVSGAMTMALDEVR